MGNINNKKRAGEMYAFLIGTIIGLLIIGAMFFGYGIYKSGTSNSQIFTAVQNGDLNKLSSLRLNNKIPVNTDKIVVFKRGDNTVDLSTLTDTGSAYPYIVSNDPAVSEGVITKQDFFALDDEKIISKGFITPGSSTERIPKYFGVPNSSTISGFTVYETSDTAYFSNAVASAPQTPTNWYSVPGDRTTISGEVVVFAGTYNGKNIFTTEGDGVYDNWSNTQTFCNDLTYGGFSDWKLPDVSCNGNTCVFGAETPNEGELFLLYNNKDAIGGFNSGFYQSSVEDEVGYSLWGYWFNLGVVGNNPQTNSNYSRCVRAE